MDFVSIIVKLFILINRHKKGRKIPAFLVQFFSNIIAIPGR